VGRANQQPRSPRRPPPRRSATASCCSPAARAATRSDSEEALAEAEVLAGLLEPLGIEWHGNSARGGADLIPLRAARVPLADLTPDGTEYFDYHHTADDTLDKVDPDALAQATAAWAALAWWAAETDVDFGRALEPEGDGGP
jgi:hypothetical protein